jgi:hypothetical protein
MINSRSPLTNFSVSTQPALTLPTEHLVAAGDAFSNYYNRHRNPQPNPLYPSQKPTSPSTLTTAHNHVHPSA